MPAVDESIRKSTIKLALEEYQRNGETRTERISFRGKAIDLPVVRLNPHQLLFNDNNSRLRAQILDDPQGSLVTTNPVGDEAQQVIARLLRDTEEYRNLKSQVKDLRQLEPGIVTRDGLVVDGNTRLVIIRELNDAGVEHAKGIDVAVMPADATTADCVDVEMTRQMRKLVHQPYTFTNELLMIKAYLNSGNTADQLANLMGWFKRKSQKVNEKLALLNLVEEIRGMTKPPIHYSVFDGKSQHLKDLLEKYQQLSAEDPAAANQMKYGRILGMFLGLNKDFTREIGYDFFEDKVMPRLVDVPQVREMFNGFSETAVEEHPEDAVIFGTPETLGIDAKKFVEAQLRELVDQDGFIREDREDNLNELAGIIKTIAVDEIRAKNLEDIKTKPIAAMQSIKESLEDILVALEDALRRDDFNLKDFQFEFSKVQHALEEVKRKMAN